MIEINLDILIFSLGLMIIAMIGYFLRSRTIVRIFLTTAFTTLSYYFLKIRGTNDITVYDLASLVFVCSTAATILSFSVKRRDKSRL